MKVIYVLLLSLLTLSAALAQSNDPAAKLHSFLESLTKPPVTYGDKIYCTTPEGRSGVCVTERQCLSDGLNKGGVGILTPKSMPACPTSKPKCCEAPNEHPIASTTTTPFPNPMPIPNPVPVPNPVPIPNPVPVPNPVPMPNPAPVPNPGPGPNVESRFIPRRKVGCGWRKESGISRIVSNDEAMFGEFPWTVAVFKVYDGNDEDYLCTGSLIHPKVVLSAGNYFKRQAKWNVRAGEHDLAGPYELFPHQTSAVERAVTHENFNSGNLSNNIALLYLAKEIELSSIYSHIGFACLPIQTQVPSAGTRCIATGWGSDTADEATPHEVMKMVELPIVERSQCQRALRAYTNPRLQLDNSVLCAGGESGQDTCRGDGGGPLVCLEPGTRGRFYQAGIVSWGVGCGINLLPGVYTDVAALRPWIDQQMSNWGFDSSNYTPVN